MSHTRKRERSAKPEAENVALSSTASKRAHATVANSSVVPSSSNSAMQPRVVNTTSESSGGKGASRPRPPPLNAGVPVDTTASRAVERLHYTGNTTARAAAASSLGGSASASTRSSDSGASASSTSTRALRGCGRPQQPLRPPLSRFAASSAPRGAAPPPARARAAAGVCGAVEHAAVGASAPAVAALKGGNAASRSDPPPTDSEVRLRATWREKRELLEGEVQTLTQYSHSLTEETLAVQDAIEGMLTEFEGERQRIEMHHAATVARYEGFMSSLRAREDACLTARQRALDRISSSRETVAQLQREQEATRCAIVSATDKRNCLEQRLARAKEAAAERAIDLQRLQQQEDRMKDATYGLSGEVKELILEMERLRKEKYRIEVQWMEAEVARRELYSLCEELKGSIRVYCRVKGVALLLDPQRPSDDTAFHEASAPKALAPSKVDDLSTGAGGTAGATYLAPATMPPPRQPPSRRGSLESSFSAGVLALVSTPTSASGTAAATADPRHNAAGGAIRSGRSTTRSSLAMASAIEEGEVDSTAGEGTTSVFTFPDQEEADDLISTNRKAEESGLLRVHGAAPTATADDATATSTPAVTPLLCASTAQSKGEEEERDASVTATAAAAAAGLPHGCGRSISIHQTRPNATSTGLSSFTETFTYDKVFTGEAQQAEVYRDVEPLVLNAVDGYRVCIFAYGQTGSGKTFTMEGDVRGRPELYGVTPRALQTVLQRQAELANEGWRYELSCTFIEIYNDVIRDLFQSGSARYEAAIQQQQTTSTSSASSAVYHTIKHSGDRTHITNVVERNISSMEEFLQLYKHAVLQRSTAKTDLNEASSRSHCVFTLHISGTNTAIRQRSDGVLCLVDLAGSERVSDSGVQGKQFKEAVNINRSLLDLGKCIRALRCGAVVPWRNCKLTFLLQNHLGARGGKVLMIVTVSNAKAHALESLNSLRFAARVQETYIGTSVKRVCNM
ncbi:hypothetical protein GH5_04065 [Leishmania sp. Ghana 2012 LV757]|uniref:hypothetical protein n=1 Tax=Leishmania sp. Ghana 2012 LV757 TaxID=2803181 RepID=UPI001B542F06|nr:hypothetical protein GH5_04065 [Leishmania sp. Ghana 2012 LV757]